MGKAKTDPAENPGAEPPESAETFVVSVTAPGGARRRAGFDFGREPVHLTASEFSGAVEAALMADPQIVIRPYRERDTGGG